MTERPGFPRLDFGKDPNRRRRLVEERHRGVGNDEGGAEEAEARSRRLLLEMSDQFSAGTFTVEDVLDHVNNLTSGAFGTHADNHYALYQNQSNYSGSKAGAMMSQTYEHRRKNFTKENFYLLVARGWVREVEGQEGMYEMTEEGIATSQSEPSFGGDLKE